MGELPYYSEQFQVPTRRSTSRQRNDGCYSDSISKFFLDFRKGRLEHMVELLQCEQVAPPATHLHHVRQTRGLVFHRRTYQNALLMCCNHLALQPTALRCFLSTCSGWCECVWYIYRAGARSTLLRSLNFLRCDGRRY